MSIRSISRLPEQHPRPGVVGRCSMRMAAVTGALAAGLTGPITLAAPAMAGEGPTVTTVISHEDEVNVIPADPDCGAPVATTETQEGTERLHIVESEDDFHFVAGEAVWITGAWDDPALGAPPPRQVTDAVVFHSINDGEVVVFHESFHDNGTLWGDIAVHEAYVEVNGDVKVERFFGRNLPPDGC